MDNYEQHAELEELILSICSTKKERKQAKHGMFAAYTILNEYIDQNRELESTEEFAILALSGANERNIDVCAYMLDALAPALHFYLAYNRVYG